MVASCTGQGKHINRSTRRGGSDSGSDFFTTKFPQFTAANEFTDVIRGVLSRIVTSFQQASYGLQGSQTSDVRAHNRAAVSACDVN